MDGRAAHRQPTTPREGAAREPLASAGASRPPGWDQPLLPGWAPLVDPAPSASRPPLGPAAGGGRPLAVGGFLAVVAFVFGHDDPAPGLSMRGLLTLALAAAALIILTIRRRCGPGPLARALAEYAVVVLLVALLATSRRRSLTSRPAAPRPGSTRPRGRLTSRRRPACPR